MTINQAISKAIKVFNKEKGKVAEFRGAELYEGSGRRDKWDDLLVHITYATIVEVDGHIEEYDYTESDSKEFLVKVIDKDGTITASRI